MNRQSMKFDYQNRNIHEGLEVGYLNLRKKLYKSKNVICALTFSIIFILSLIVSALIFVAVSPWEVKVGDVCLSCWNGNSKQSCEVVDDLE